MTYIRVILVEIMTQSDDSGYDGLGDLNSVERLIRVALPAARGDVAKVIFKLILPISVLN